MFSRIRIALGLAALVALIASITVFAKGSYAFITIVGPNINDAVRSTDQLLTADFFAFADFYNDKTAAPQNPGEGYEITRYYVDGGRESAFDQLHYYPQIGFVFYDGIVNGDSEYDGKWYKANPDILKPFQTALSIPITNIAPAAQPEPVKSVEQTQPNTQIPQASPITIILAVIAGLFFIVLGSIYWRRKLST